MVYYSFEPDEEKSVGPMSPLNWDPKMFQFPVDIITREAWGALPPKRELKEMKVPVLVVYLTYTNTDQCSTRQECSKILQDMQKDHMDKGHDDLHFNFMVGGDGNVYEGTCWQNVGKEPSRPEYDHDDKVAIAWIRRGEDDEDDRAEQLMWRGTDFLDWAYRMRFLY